LCLWGCRDRLGQPGVSGDANYTQAFTNASTVTVNHNLGKYPAVTVYQRGR
jgi:hypothetical protein